jgi:hypothetical protein
MVFSFHAKVSVRIVASLTGFEPSEKPKPSLLQALSGLSWPQRIEVPEAIGTP